MVLFHLKKLWLHGGFVGVNVFLVIAGFLVTRFLVVQMSAGEFSLPAFLHTWSLLVEDPPRLAIGMKNAMQ